MANLKRIKISPAIILSFITLATGLAAQFILNPEIPLFYGLPQTEEQLSPSIFILLPASISFLVVIVNSYLSSKTTDNYLKKCLAVTSIACSILSFIATVKIIFLVGSI